MTENYKTCMHSDESTVATVSARTLYSSASAWTLDSSSSLDSSATRVSQRQVRFSLESNQVFPILHINDMDASDIHERWYGEQDGELMKRDIMAVVYKMRNNIKVEETSDEETVRGLECQTWQGESHREENKSMAHDAVLMEQDRQRMVGVPDEELVAQAYYNVSFRCQVAAFKLGLRDEQAVMKKNFEKVFNDKKKSLIKSPGIISFFRRRLCPLRMPKAA
jgi:hypothetical protein